MIQSLSGKYRKYIAYPLFIIFYLQNIAPLQGASVYGIPDRYSSSVGTKWTRLNKNQSLKDFNSYREERGLSFFDPKKSYNNNKSANKYNNKVSLTKLDIGGPSSPEATSFKSGGSNNLVNLFTGDFSYSIPLLDVGGYPVNIYYTGGATMDQDASWVGLGWNINPGSVSRNMRGVPDDFNGADKLIQKQNVKPNRTWGAEIGYDGELFGWKKPKFSLSAGFSFNNYLGPAIDLGAGANLSFTENVKAEKAASTDMGLSGALNMKLSSRSGLTFSPSLNASVPLTNNNLNLGVGLTTSYNSRTGISSLTLNSDVSEQHQQDHDEDNVVRNSIGIGSTTFNFAKPTYMPALRFPMQNTDLSGRIEFGLGAYGVRGALTGAGYYSESVVPDESKTQQKPLVGFMYSENAINNKNAVMDFNRIGDGAVTPNTPIISAPIYSYDIFTIQGEGTGGSIRAYRSDMGFMRDNLTTSKEKNLSFGVDIAPPGHYGVNFNVVHTPTKVGGWDDMNNTLSQTLSFQPKQTNTSFENIYFRSPGEATVTNDEILNRIGGDNLVRFKLGGSYTSPRLESTLEQFNKNTGASKGTIPVAANNLTKRDKRTQVTTMLTADDATNYGLESSIRSYDGNFSATPNNNILYNNISRVGNYRKGHHISEIDVLEQNGMRYVYGVPVYNILQRDYTFSVNNTGDPTSNLVSFSADEPTVNSQHMASNSSIDGYVMTQETPGYASAFLLTGLISPDYVDLTGNGITEDDIGTAVKFNYCKSDSIHRWRTPRNNSVAFQANFNDGVRTEKRDNKATISYGEREVWYLNSIESKSMIAIFRTDSCSDRKGVISDLDGRVNSSENANKKLIRIDLYTKSEIKNKGINNAIPIKSVNFEYDYTLCKGTPDNSHGGGKLTLKTIYFTYNGLPRVAKDKYVFNYGDPTSKSDNPDYTYNASDRWGTYKNPSTDAVANPAANPGGLTNIDFPYTSVKKPENDIFASVWSLKKILLPTGGQIEVQYEADDYAYVQNRRACNMFSIAGLGQSQAFTSNNSLYNGGLPISDNYFVYVKLLQPLQSADPIKAKQEIFYKYLEGINQLAFKMQVNMPKGPEPLTIYSEFDDYGVCINNPNYIFIRLKPLNNASPLATSAIGFLTENIPGQAFPGYDATVNNLGDFIGLVGDMLSSIASAFKNVDRQMRDAGKAKDILLDRSFIRLDNPFWTKYGGGYRVKRVLLKNNWLAMTQQYNSITGQDYEYTTNENVNGKDMVISSGVASYEPGIGSEENPFREIVSFSNKLPLASAQYGAIEMPMLEALYPAPCVGYSKVTVRSIHRKGVYSDSTLRSGVGKQVTEYYTARDYPTHSINTGMNSVDYNKNPFFSFLYKETINRRTISQGFLVETNDMHGKMKSQSAYSENDENTPLSYSYYSYRNTGKNGLNDKVDFIYNDRGGVVQQGNMGIDAELMTDVREFKVQSDGFSGQMQLDWFFFFAVNFAVPTFWGLHSYQENLYRAVTCTKLINYHAIEDSVIVMDKGSVITTKTIAYDAETGSPIVTKTANEFNDPIYNASYPAYWAYSGVSPAYKNIGREFSGLNFYDGKITNAADVAIDLNEAFESGDEIYITAQNPPASVIVPKVSGTVSYACSATNNGQGEVTLTFNLLHPAPHGLRLYVAFVYQNNQGYGWGGINLPAGTSLQGNSAPIYIDIPEGATSYTTPFPNLNSSGQFWPCYDNLGGEEFLYKKDMYLKVYEPSNYIVDLTLIPNSPLAFHNDISNVPPPTPVCIPPTGNVGMLWAFDTTKTISSLTQINKVLVFMTKGGNLFTGSGVSCKIVRSGKRNNIGLTVSSITAMKNPIQNGKLVIDNNSNIVTSSSVALKEKWSQDCLNTNTINPYVTGILGNFKPYRSYIYYGDRKESDANSTTHIRTNGYLNNFSNYWNFNIANKLIPDTSNKKWVWNSELMEINAKGQEIETRDALGRYTSAQYGFNKNFPVAVVQNSKESDMYYEGFEDYGYSEAINGTNICNERKLNISNPDGYGHTGNKGLMVWPGSNNITPLYVTTPIYDHNSDSIKFNFPRGQITGTSVGGDPGVTGSINSNLSFYLSPNFYSADIGIPIGTSNPVSTTLQMEGFVSGNNLSNLPVAFYLKGGYYNEYSGCQNASFNVVYLTINIYDSNNNIIATTSAGGNHSVNGNNGFQFFPINGNPSLFAANQYYDVKVTVGLLASYPQCSNYENGASFGIEGFLGNYFNSNFPSYPEISSFKNIIINNTTCGSYTLPISYSSDMSNPKFYLKKGNRMLISAWVSEWCGTPCTKTNFDHCHLELKENSTAPTFTTVTLKPAGAIIEGWQKIIGEFTLPNNFDYYKLDMTLANDNTDGSFVLFDDIRIHPYNANMKNYVYDPRTLKLIGELDENNYATFYEYDEEGQLIRTKKETIQGIKTIQETRSAKQRVVTDVQ